MTPSAPIRSAFAARSSVGSNTTRSGGEGSLTICRFLIKVGIDVFLEGFDAGAVHHVDKALALAVPEREIGFDQSLDHVGDAGPGEGRSNAFSKRSGRLIAADFNLVPLLPVLIDAKNPYMADMMVAASVHAARDVEVQLADVVQVVEIVEAALDVLGHRDRLGVGERAEIPARAANDVGQQADVRRGEAEAAQLEPQAVQLGLAHVGEDQVLLVRD